MFSFSSFIIRWNAGFAMWLDENGKMCKEKDFYTNEYESKKLRFKIHDKFEILDEYSLQIKFHRAIIIFRRTAGSNDNAKDILRVSKTGATKIERYCSANCRQAESQRITCTMAILWHISGTNSLKSYKNFYNIF